MPVAVKPGIRLALRLVQVQLNPGEFDQLDQAVRVRTVGPVLVREIVQVRLFRDARLERAFDGVAGEVIGGRPAAGCKQRLRVGDPVFLELLKFESVHRKSRPPDEGGPPDETSVGVSSGALDLAGFSAQAAVSQRLIRPTSSAQEEAVRRAR